MWTKSHLARQEARPKEIVTANAVGEIARWLDRADPPHSDWRTPLHQIMAALAWHLREWVAGRGRCTAHRCRVRSGTRGDASRCAEPMASCPRTFP